MITLCISGCQQASTNTLSKDVHLSGIQEIDYQQLTNKIDNKESFIIYIGRPDCLDCVEFTPILETFLSKNQGMYVYYVNIKTYRDNAMKPEASMQEIEFYENLKEQLQYDWTPTLQFISNGAIIDSYEYLSVEYYKIEDENTQIQEKEKYIDNFETWMNEKFR